MTDVQVRLALWTAEACVALMFTAWLIVDNLRNHQAVRVAIEDGRLHPRGGCWWVSVTELGASIGMLGAWLALIVVGVLGFMPSMAEYRSWFQLVAVTLLATVQLGRVVARRGTQRSKADLEVGRVH